MEDFEGLISKASCPPVNIEFKGEDICGFYFSSGATRALEPILLTHKSMEYPASTENHRYYQTHEDNLIILPPLY
jgi:hypothetical protein